MAKKEKKGSSLINLKVNLKGGVDFVMRNYRNVYLPLALLSFVIFVVVFVFSSFSANNYFGFGNTSSQLYSEEYQAVFLNNGQVYFGKITEEHGDTVVMEDIYYLQVNRQNDGIQETGEASNSNELNELAGANGSAVDPQNGQPNISLIKLGSELHGPTDRINFVRSNILFTEDLKQDSQVVTGIKADKEGK